MAGEKVKVLLITGSLAKETVKRYAKESRLESDVLVSNMAIAAFLTPQNIAETLKKAKLRNIDLILVPGLVRGDTSLIFQATGIPAFKGPRYAADLPTVLESLNEITLSTIVPADDLLREKLQQKAFEEIARTEEEKGNLLRKPGNILVKNLAVGKDFPMRVMAEIVDAALKPNEEIQRLSKLYVKSGADIIDIGMVVGESRPFEAKRIVSAAKATVNVPVSIDSLDPEEIKAGVSSGADLVLSGDAGNLESIAPFLSDVAVVAIPTNQKEGYFPKKAKERVKFLEEIVNRAKTLGVTKIFADLILDPSNILESFVAYRQYAERNPNVPLFVGISNVTELIDADSIGVNALLAKLASEVTANLLLATEQSDKTKGTIKEESTAAKMMFLSSKRNSVPKDLGIDLLMLKDKRNREEPYNKELEEKTHLFLADQTETSGEGDEKGSFRIIVDREKECIVALHFTLTNFEKPDMVVKGKSAESVYRKIVELNLVSKLDHAAYLGSELSKAEIALRSGKEFIQDKLMFGE